MRETGGKWFITTCQRAVRYSLERIQLGEPAGLLAPVGIEIVQTGIDGKVVGLVFAAVQYDEHHVALAERAVESPGFVLGA